MGWEWCAATSTLTTGSTSSSPTTACGINSGSIAATGTFIDAGLQTGCAVDLEGRQRREWAPAADIDDDGDLDIIVCNLRRESDSVFINARTHFSDETTRGGCGSSPGRSPASAWDGLTSTTTVRWTSTRRTDWSMREDRQLSADPYAQPNLLFQGMPSTRGVFDECGRGGTPELLVTTSRAAAFGDIDNDGAIDILVVNRDARAHLLRNVTAAHSASAGQPNHWVIFRVLDEHGRDAAGARCVKSGVGKRVMQRRRAAYSYLASNDPRVHVGLGAAIRADEVAVRWTDGSTQSFGPMPADQIHTLRRKPRN